MFKPRRVKLEGGGLRATGIFRSVFIPFNEIKRIEVRQVASLVDELGVTIYGKDEMFFTDADHWFLDVANALRFAQLFGDDWYARAEHGEVLQHEGQLNR